MSDDRDTLQQAFFDTDYRVRLPRGGYATIRIGRPLPAPLALTLPQADAPWAFVTAWNPLSATQPLATNRMRQRKLLAAVRKQASSAVVMAGVGVGAHARWQEPSLFVIGLSFDRLDRLMRPFRQHAIVRGVGDCAAQLHWL